MIEKFRYYFLSRLLWLIYCLLSWSWKKVLFESEDLKAARQQGRPILFAHWHGDELAILTLIPRYQIVTMTSTSRDGSLIDFVIRRLGGATARGSSTRGGSSALRNLVKLCRSGRNASMAVDGPKGPRHKVKPGVFELARLSDACIIPVGVHAEHSHIFKKSWNQAILPRPATRVVVYMGPAYPLPQDADVKSAELAHGLEVELHRVAKLAQQF